MESEENLSNGMATKLALNGREASEEPEGNHLLSAPYEIYQYPIEMEEGKQKQLINR